MKLRIHAVRTLLQAFPLPVLCVLCFLCCLPQQVFAKGPPRSAQDAAAQEIRSSAFASGQSEGRSESAQKAQDKAADSGQPTSPLPAVNKKIQYGEIIIHRGQNQ